MKRCLVVVTLFAALGIAESIVIIRLADENTNMRTDLHTINSGPKCGGAPATWTDADGTKHVNEQLPCQRMIFLMNLEMDAMADALEKRDAEIDKLKENRPTVINQTSDGTPCSNIAAVAGNVSVNCDAERKKGK